MNTNHWLDIIKKKKLFKDIDECGMDTLGEDGTFADFINSLDPEQLQFLMRMNFTGFISDIDEFYISIELNAP